MIRHPERGVLVFRPGFETTSREPDGALVWEYLSLRARPLDPPARIVRDAAGHWRGEVDGQVKASDPALGAQARVYLTSWIESVLIANGIIPWIGRDRTFAPVPNVPTNDNDGSTSEE